VLGAQNRTSPFRITEDRVLGAAFWVAALAVVTLAPADVGWRAMRCAEERAGLVGGAEGGRDGAVCEGAFAVDDVDVTRFFMQQAEERDPLCWVPKYWMGCAIIMPENRIQDSKLKH
jgi:hypothetical protein